MKTGHTLFELLIYIVIVSLILSLIFPRFNTMVKLVLLYEDVKATKSMIRYARIFSYLKSCKVCVFLTNEHVVVKFGKKTLKKYDLKITKIKGDKCFAFSKGIPYISGKTEFSVGDSFPVVLTVTPVVGRINVKKREW